MATRRSRRRSRSSRKRGLPTIEQWLRFRRRKWTWRSAIVVTVLAVAMLLDRGGFFLAERDDFGLYDQKALDVARIIDGDTLAVAMPDYFNAPPGDSRSAPAFTRVRVWGIDTPEMGRLASPTEPARDAEPFAQEATDLATELLHDQTVTLHLERSRPRGNFGRLLAHVELPNGELLAERLLLAGLARADARWPHRHAERFALLERQARADRVGLWSTPQDPYAAFPPATSDDGDP